MIQYITIHVHTYVDYNHIQMYSASITYYVQIITKTAHLIEQLQQNYAINQRMHTIKTLYSSNTNEISTYLFTKKTSQYKMVYKHISC